MTDIICPEDGEVSQLTIDGYVLGHRTEPNGPNELDLEGIMFTFNVDEPPESLDDQMSLSLADADGAEGYLSKFADWEDHVVQAAERADEFICGEDGCINLVRFEEES